MLWCAALLCLAGALVLLDKWTLGEFGFSQPIVGCPLLGLLFGDGATGLLLGTALQLVWIEALPLGGEKPLDYQSAGIVGATSYLFARRLGIGQDPGQWPTVQGQVLLVCLVLAALATILGQYADGRVRRINDCIYTMGMDARRPSGVFAAQFLAFVPALLRGILVIAFFLLAMRIIMPYLHYLPRLSSGELLLCPLAIGIAGLFKLFYRRRLTPLFAVGVVLSAILWVFWK